MKALLLTALLSPYIAFANWRIDLTLAVDGETWRADQVLFEDGKEKAFDFGRHLMKLMIQKSKEEKGLDVTYLIQEKRGSLKVILNKGTENIEENTKADIYAKGEPNQPNSVITFKFLK